MKPDSPSGFWSARVKSFACAARGIVLLLRTQANARIHLIATVAVVVAGITFHITRGEWALLSVAIGIVWITEALNTALELLADRVTREPDDLIRRIKDAAAGAVLFAAITATVIGILILGPHAWALLRGA
jgi:diacylglycerol kinase (ATP)